MLTLLFLAAAAAVLGQGDAEFKRVCYVSNWAQYRPGDGSFKPPAIDPTLCTHINYAFGVINTAFDIIPYEWNDDGPGGLYEQVNAHKATNPSLKTLIAIGGWNFGMDLIAQMLSNAANRQHFVDSAISFQVTWLRWSRP
jgi:chitinase